MKDKKISTYSSTVTAQNHFEGSSVLHFNSFFWFDIGGGLENRVGRYKASTS